MRISDWSSDVCSSDLQDAELAVAVERQALRREGLGGDRSARGERHDGVMDVQHGVAPEVSQRRDLVRPAPVVELTVFVGNRRLPARVEESMLEFLDTRARHHEVDVDGNAAPRRGQLRPQLDRAFTTPDGNAPAN